jgi:hypothetical protein
MLVVLACGAAVVAGLRSTWSPCSLSMLSAMTPLSERGRGYRYGPTMFWFAVGCLAGGATLGVGLALLAGLVHLAALSTAVAAALVAIVAFVCAASDLRLGGFRLPAHDRQVNEDWFPRYRRWVYASGFGWQLGVGVATFITTAAIYLMIASAALTGDALAAFCVALLFSGVRALAILPARSLTSLESISALLRRLETWAEPSRRLTAGAQCALGVVALFVAGGAWWGLVGAVALTGGIAISALRTRRRPLAHT